MSATNRITLALRPREGETLDGLQFYAQLGAPVAIGRALGVIASLSVGDAIDRLHDLEDLVSVQIENIDEHVRMARDAARYRWLRGCERVKDAGTDLIVGRGDYDCFFDAELDREVDDVMRLERLLEKHGEPV